MLILIVFTLCTGLELYNYENLQHYGYVKIGGQEIPVMFDTGSERTWVASIYCYSRGCNKHLKFNPYNSLTFTSLDSEFEIQYGSGFIRGELAYETIEIDNLVIQNLEIGLVSAEIGQVFEKIPFAGIIGIAPSKNANSFIFQIYKQLNISSISISLSEDSFHLGFLSFSEILPAALQSSLSEDYWQIELEKFFTADLDLCPHNECRAVIDTGTSVISVPSDLYYRLKKVLTVTNSCENVEKLPDVVIKVNQFAYQIPWHEYIAYQDGTCSLALMKFDVPEPTGPFFILGGTFLRQVVVYLDIINMKIGIAPKSGVFLKNSLVKYK